ncbi:MAG TPA: YCF48-related protein [Azospirillum sp.]|nr:YCF48-related protein [Azospirillum sp.]
MRRALGLAAKAGPFLIIAGLIGAVFAVKLEPVVHAVAEPALAPRDLFLGAAAPADGVLWMVGSEGKIVRSDDGGRSWRVQRSGTARMLQAVAAWSAMEAAAVGADGAVLVTRDGGATWQPAAPLDKPHRLLAAALDASGRLWVAGEMGTLLVSADRGRSFTAAAEPRDVGLNGIAFAGSDTGWVVGEFGEARHTADGGRTWTAVDAAPRSLMATAACGGATGVAVGLEGTVVRTADGGRTWTPVATPLREPLFAVTCADGRWTAVGDRGAILTGSIATGDARAVALAGGLPAWRAALLRVGDRLLAAGAGAGWIAADGPDGRFIPFPG